MQEPEPQSHWAEWMQEVINIRMTAAKPVCFYARKKI
jgi:hypothetical protein